jgi:hypothetical protein
MLVLHRYQIMKRRSAVSALLFALLVLPLGILQASDDWPQWRGPNRDGHSPDKGLLNEWPAEGPKLAWKATGLGIGYTNVAVVGDRIFKRRNGPWSWKFTAKIFASERGCTSRWNVR